MSRKIIEQIKRCSEPGLLKTWIENAIRQGNEEVERGARLRLYAILPSATPGTLEYDVWQSIYALEDLEARKKGKTIRLQRTRNMIKERGEIGTVAHLVRRKSASTGFQMLIDYGLPNLTFEALVLKHTDAFDDDLLEAARNRLDGAGHGDIATEARRKMGGQQMESEERREPRPPARRIIERARAGDSFTFGAREYASGDFVKIAAACAEGGGHLTIIEAKRIARPIREKIEEAGRGHVTLRL